MESLEQKPDEAAKMNTEMARLNLKVLSVALARHVQLLESGLTAYEAQCAVFSDEVEQALDASTSRVQENFGLFMQYQVGKFCKEAPVAQKVLENNIVCMSAYIAKKDQQQLAGRVPAASLSTGYADDELSYASR